MAIRIIRGDEPLTIGTVKVLMYGQPGAGKTSLGFSACNPILLDFDKRTYTAKNRKDALEITGWNDITDLMSQHSVLKPYQTIVIDTVGRCLDYLQAHLIENDLKLANRNGGLTLQGYGALKSSFTNWIRQLTTLGKDIVMIAHDREDKDGDTKIVRPDITGGSYSEVMKVADFVGYLYMGDQTHRILNFNPTDRWIGKNSANLNPLTVPNLDMEPDWFANIIAQMKSGLGGISEAQKQSVATLLTWKDAISNYGTLEEFNHAVAEIEAVGKPLSLQLWSILKSRADGFGFFWNKNDRAFEAHQPVANTVETPSKSANARSSSRKASTEEALV